MAQKTGADAVSLAVSHICRIITKYGPKLEAFLAASVAAGIITTDQQTIALQFLSAATASCAIWQIVAKAN